VLINVHLLVNELPVLEECKKKGGRGDLTSQDNMQKVLKIQSICVISKLKYQHDKTTSL